MLAHARRPLPAGTPLCILQRERVDTSWGIGPRAFSSTSLPAVGSCLYPAACWGQPWGWERAAGVGLGGGSCFAPRLRSPLPASAAVTAGSGALRLPGGPHWPGLAAAGGLAPSPGPVASTLGS